MSIPLLTRESYASCLTHNLMVADESSVRVETRDPRAAAERFGPSVFAFRFYDVVATTTELDGEIITLRSDRINKSPWYHVSDGKITMEVA